MKGLINLLLMIFVLSFLTVSAFGTPINDNGYEDSLQEILNNITLNGDSSVDASGVTNDAIGYDANWMINGSGGSLSTFVIELTAGFASQSFGIYDSSNSSKMIEIFSGAQSTGSQVLLSILADGSVIRNFSDTGINFASNNFGYYMGTGSYIFYSDTGLNSDQFDHMVAFQGTGDTVQILPYAAGSWGTGEYVLGWEDAFNGGDADYQDMVVMVESVTPVPEPATMLLLGTGLVGLAGFGRKRFFNKG